MPNMMVSDLEQKLLENLRNARVELRNNPSAQFNEHVFLSNGQHWKIRVYREGKHIYIRLTRKDDTNDSAP